jgi:probable HAF family extracellular repeat protein
VVGHVVDNGTAHAFSWENGTFKYLQYIFGDVLSSALGINNKGSIIGAYDCKELIEQCGFIIPAGTERYIDLGTFGIITIPHDINENDVIVGASAKEHLGDSDAFMWKKGFLVDLEPIMKASGLDVVSSVAYAINEKGWIVGDYQNSNGQNRAFLIVNSKAFDLSALIVSSGNPPFGSNYSMSAFDIDDSGNIVGTINNMDTSIGSVWKLELVQ